MRNALNVHTGLSNVHEYWFLVLSEMMPQDNKQTVCPQTRIQAGHDPQQGLDNYIDRPTGLELTCKRLNRIIETRDLSFCWISSATTLVGLLFCQNSCFTPFYCDSTACDAPLLFPAYMDLLLWKPRIFSVNAQTKKAEICDWQEVILLNIYMETFTS